MTFITYSKMKKFLPIILKSMVFLNEGRMEKKTNLSLFFFFLIRHYCTMLSIISQVRNDKNENIVVGTFFKLLFCPLKVFCFANTAASIS